MTAQADTIPYKAHTPEHQGLSSLHYYDASPLAGSRWYRPEVVWPAHGVAGELLPYTVSRDNAVTGALLLCFVFSAVSVAFSRDFILRHLHNFFYVPRSQSDVVETGAEVRFQLFLCLQTSLLMAIVFYLYTRYADGGHLAAGQQLLPLAVFTAIGAAYLVVKWAAHQVVDHTFFAKRQVRQWSLVRLFLTSSEGVLLFPVVVVQIYCGLPLAVTLFYALFVVVVVKIMAFYKAQTIFFKASGGFVQNILYLCALELLPLGALWGVLNIVQHYLKVNF